MEFLPVVLTTAVVTLGICYLESSASLTMEQKRTIALEEENRDLRRRPMFVISPNNPAIRAADGKGFFSIMIQWDVSTNFLTYNDP